MRREDRQLLEGPYAEPRLSDVEALYSLAEKWPLPTEDAATTLEGVMGSALTLAATAARALVEVWQKRRAEPALLTQPRERATSQPSRNNGDNNAKRGLVAGGLSAGRARRQAVTGPCARPDAGLASYTGAETK
jgi:hypothetical protein